MKKAVLYLCLIISACNSNNADDKKYVKGEDPVFDHKVDSMVSHEMLNAQLKDTGSLSGSPVKIISARPTTKEYSNYKDISVTYKNVSNKVIAGIKFKWSGVNAFGEPADMGALYEGIGAGFDDDELKPGKSRTATFEILSKDLKRVTKAWPYEVAFTDGTKWQLNN